MTKQEIRKNVEPSRQESQDTMKTFTKLELAVVLEKHAKWLRNEDGGERADLSRAYLSGADLSGADLSRAYLSGAYLSRAYLSGADLSRADLSGACYAWAQVAFSEHGECGRMLVAFQAAEDSPVFQCGCFYGSESDLRTYIEDGNPELKESRLLALECALKLISYRKGGAMAADH